MISRAIVSMLSPPAAKLASPRPTYLNTQRVRIRAQRVRVRIRVSVGVRFGVRVGVRVSARTHHSARWRDRRHMGVPSGAAIIQPSYKGVARLGPGSCLFLGSPSRGSHGKDS